MTRTLVALVAVVALALTGTAAAMTKSQAKAVARDVNLKASDMPGFHTFDTSPQLANSRIDAQIAGCARSVPLSRALAQVASPVFEAGNEADFVMFRSVVALFPSARLARSDLSALRSARARNCLRDAIKAVIAGAGVPVTVTASALPTQVRGVVGHRIKVVGRSAGANGTSWFDYFFMGTRAGEARVIVTSHPGPPGPNVIDPVLRNVKTRLEARLNPDAIL